MRFSHVVFSSLTVLTLLGAGCTPDTVVTGMGDTSSDQSSTSADTSMGTYSYQGKLPDDQIQNKQVRITTNKGDIVIAFYPDTAPLAVSNFIYLAGQGFYDNVIFHRVISGFMIQGGDPTGTGMGGPGYKFQDELSDSHTYERGTVAMANSGANTNGSQFFIMHKDYPLPHSYTIFGHVTSGLDVVDAIAATPTDGNDRPLSDIVMEKVTVEDIK